MRKILGIVEGSSKKLLYVADETAVRTEANNRLTWSPVGHPPVVEKNGIKDGLKLIGATEISKKFHTIADIYAYKQSITSNEFIVFLQHLLDINKDKKIFLVVDNAKIHKSLSVKVFCELNRKNLTLIYLPPYSPELNPQENVWNRYKASIYTSQAKSSKEVLYDDTCYFYESINQDVEAVRKLINPYNFFKD